MSTEHSPLIHTPLPWYCVHVDERNRTHGTPIAQIDDWLIESSIDYFNGLDGEADARLIVHRVNTYEDLVEALEDAYEVIPADCTDTLHAIEAALSLAREENNG